MLKKFLSAALGALLLIGLTAGCNDETVSKEGVKEFLNVSYDPTRELFAAYNDKFKPHWKEVSGEDVILNQSHGGSGKQVSVHSARRVPALRRWHGAREVSSSRDRLS